jgi:hypothetical protein
MRRSILASLLVLALGAFLFTVIGPGAIAEDKKEDAYTYMGVKKCKLCHKKESGGDQFGLWTQRKHSKAYESLASEAAIADAKKRGITCSPQEAPECLKCHATAFAVMADLENQAVTLEEGVSCESCHGPGSGYWSMKVMKGLYAGEVEAASVGLWTITEETCAGCHTAEGNSFYKEFNYEEALKTIAHPVPEKKK